MEYNQDRMNIIQAKDTLKTAVKLYFMRDSQGSYRVSRRRARPLCLMGPAGIGKTEIVTQVAKELNLALCSYSLVHHTRQSLLGLPRLESCEIDGKTVSCTRYTMSEIVDAIHQTMAETGLREGILFLDEFNCVNESIRPIMLQLLQDKALGTHPIPDGWMVVLAGNPTKYNKSARDLDAVTTDRLRIMEVDADLTCWLSYARAQEIHPVVISFLEEHHDCFYRHSVGSMVEDAELITPRGWEDMSIQLKLMEEIGEPPTVAFLGQFFQSATVVQQFYSYYRRYASLMGNGLLQRIFRRNLATIAEIGALSTQDRWALVSAILTRIQGQAQEIRDQEITIDAVHSVLRTSRTTLKAGGATAVECLYNLAAHVTGEEVRSALLACADGVTGAQGWQEIKDYFQTQLVTPFTTATAATLTQVDNALFICNQAIRDAENAERLLHGLVEHPATAKLLSSGETPAFQELFTNTHFDSDEAYEALMNRMEAV